MRRNGNSRRGWVAGLVAGLLLAVPVGGFAAEEEKPTGSLTIAAMSQYVWRGYELSRNSVAIQPSMTIGYKGFSANFWGNLDTRPYSAGTTEYPGAWNETDFTLAYSKSLGMVTLGGGYIYYSLASMNRDAADRNDSQELFASVGLDMLLAPTLTLYKEIDHYRNWYVTLGISHGFELHKRVSLNLAATAGYLLSTDAASYPKYDDNAAATTDKFSNFHDGTLSASLPIQVADGITVTPMVSYIFPLSSDAKNEMRGLGMKGTATAAERDGSFIVGGLSLSYSF